MRVVITGVRESHQEGFIAATFTELGWQVAYRATSAENLKEALHLNPASTVVISDDFMSRESIVHDRVIFIKGKANSVGLSAIHNPLTPQDFHELIRVGFEKVDSPHTRTPPSRSNLHLFVGASGGIGTSTLALNYAAEISLLGKSVLFIDAHIGHPFIPNHLSLHRIDEQILTTRFGFSVTELNSRESLERVNNTSEPFEIIIMDIGEFHNEHKFIQGRRARDVIHTWAVDSASSISFVSSEKRESIRASFEASQKLKEQRPRFHSRYPVLLTSTLGRRERDKFSKEMSMTDEHPLHCFSRDRRALQAMERERSTLAVVAPKSILRREIMNSATNEVNKNPSAHLTLK